MVGTPRYMAPELYKFQAYPQSDLFAIAVILYTLLRKQPPWDKATSEDKGFMKFEMTHSIAHFQS